MNQYFSSKGLKIGDKVYKFDVNWGQVEAPLFVDCADIFSDCFKKITSTSILANSHSTNPMQFENQFLIEKMEIDGQEDDEKQPEIRSNSKNFPEIEDLKKPTNFQKFVLFKTYSAGSVLSHGHGFRFLRPKLQKYFLQKEYKIDYFDHTKVKTDCEDEARNVFMQKLGEWAKGQLSVECKYCKQRILVTKKNMDTMQKHYTNCKSYQSQFFDKTISEERQKIQKKLAALQNRVLIETKKEDETDYFSKNGVKTTFPKKSVYCKFRYRYTCPVPRCVYSVKRSELAWISQMQYHWYHQVNDVPHCREKYAQHLDRICRLVYQKTAYGLKKRGDAVPILIERDENDGKITLKTKFVSPGQFFRKPETTPKISSKKPKCLKFFMR